MRFLKKKLALAQQRHPERINLEYKKEAEYDSCEEVICDVPIKNKLSQLDSGIESDHLTKNQINFQSLSLPCTPKNILIDYGNAISYFILSELALPYLNSIFKDENKVLEFRQFVSSIKSAPNKLSGLRSLALPKESDTEQETTYKQAFREISEIFVKFFSVKWIMNSKLDNKLVYLKNRFKVLRRIKNPQHLVSFKNF